jgi:tetratricopeptide (TPR) repeat protein/transcriptional regulator with XRE-family HTH domain
VSGGETPATVEFGRLLRHCRRAAGLTQEELGERAGVGVRTIGDLERGRRTRPYRQTVGVLADALGLRGPQLDEFVRLSRQTAAGLTALEGAARDPSLLPRELPAAVAGFTGRESELAVLDASLVAPLAGTPLTMLIAAIDGTAGVGKTALAVQWAHQAAGSFPDGQLYLNLRGYGPDQPLSAAYALTVLLRTLGVRDQDVPPAEDERAARYRSLLAGRRMLIVLDNARDAGQVRPLLPGTPGCAAVITSRDRLAGLVARDGARRLDLDVLPLADAVSLLRTLIGNRVDAEPEAAAALAADSCRLPLALRVAAELAAARPAASLASLAAELADQQQRLDLLDADGDPGTAVRAVFSSSVRHLDPGTARAFRLTGAQPGPDLDVPAAAALTGTTSAHARRLLNQLTRAHLIQVTTAGRYVMHDLLRDYARELAADGEEQRAALTRLLDYYLHVAATAMDALYPAERDQRPHVPAPTTTVTRLTDPDTSRAWLAAELPCLVAAVAHAAAHGWPEHAIRLAATIFRYLDPSGHLSEAVTVHESARSAARLTGDAAAEARALSNLAVAELRQGRDQDAGHHLKQALSLSRQTGDHTSEARALGTLGVLAFWQGRYELAADYYEQALSLSRQSGNRAAEVTGLCNLAGTRIRLTQYEQAASYLQQALVLSRDIGNKDGEAYALLALGDTSLRQGHDDLADSYLRQGLALSRHLGDRVGEAAALSGLGELDLRQGRHQDAASQLHLALALSRQAGARSSETDALHLLGEVSLATGDHRQACTHHAAALALASQAGDMHLQARAHDGLARAAAAGADARQARHHWQQALTLYTQLGAPEADHVQSRLNEVRA